MHEKRKRKTKRLSIELKTKDCTKKIYGDTLDELIDGLAVYKDISLILKFEEEFSNCLSQKQYCRLDRLILTLESSTLELLEYAKRRGRALSIIEEIENDIIKKGHACVIYAFSLIEGFNLSRLKKAILETDDLSNIALFFKSHRNIIEENDIKELEKKALASQDVIDIERVADVNGVDIQKLQEHLFQIRYSSSTGLIRAFKKFCYFFKTKI